MEFVGFFRYWQCFDKCSFNLVKIGRETQSARNWRNEHVCYKEANIANIFRYVGVTIEIDRLLKKGLSYSLIPKPGALQVGHSLYRSLLNPDITRRICCVIGLDVTLITV